MTNEKFKILVDKYEKLVFTICYQMLNDYQEAQNLTQETFISAYIHIDTCKPDDYKPWLARIAANKAKDHLKSAYAKKVQLNENDFFNEMLSADKSPEEIFMVKQNELYLREKIYALKEPYLRVSKMYFIEEKDINYISKQLGIPKKTVQTQIYRSKIMLRELLREVN